MEELKKEMRITRFFCILSSFLTICLLAGVIFLVIQLRPIYLFIEEARPALEQMSKLDVNVLNRFLQDFDTSMGQIDWEELADSLEQLDVEAINESLQGLDVEELSAALEHINSAADTLDELGEKLGSFSSLFGR